jgi:hypothetical protein
MLSIEPMFFGGDRLSISTGLLANAQAPLKGCAPVKHLQ